MGACTVGEADRRIAMTWGELDRRAEPDRPDIAPAALEVLGN
jgi:hypothetical protein